MQVNGGHCSSDDEAKNACRQLAGKLGQDQAPAKSSFRVLAGQQLQATTHQLHGCVYKPSTADHKYSKPPASALFAHALRKSEMTFCCQDCFSEYLRSATAKLAAKAEQTCIVTIKPQA